MHFPSLSQLVQALVRRPAPKACRRRTTRAAWSPLTALESRLQVLEGRMSEIGDRISKVQDQRKLIGERLDALVRLEEFVEFDDLDWSSIAK